MTLKQALKLTTKWARGEKVKFVRFPIATKTDPLPSGKGKTKHAFKTECYKCGATLIRNIRLPLGDKIKGYRCHTHL